MPPDLLQRRPRLAYSFTILTDKNTVRLVAGEDYRYTLTGPDLDGWLPPLLKLLVGKETIAELLAPLTNVQRQAAIEAFAHLFGERVLVDGAAADAHRARKFRLAIHGQCKLAEWLTNSIPPAGGGCEFNIFCQDRLDYEAAIAFNRRCRAANTPFIWVSYAAMNRAYVSPLFLPDAGPCFGCLLRSFERLSPAPELYGALREHSRQGKPIEPAGFPDEGLQILQGLVAWKLNEAERDDPSPALYRLHVLDREHFEVTTHRVFADPFCPECGRREVARPTKENES